MDIYGGLAMSLIANGVLLLLLVLACVVAWENTHKSV